jgi:hypothetical protein
VAMGDGGVGVVELFAFLRHISEKQLNGVFIFLRRDQDGLI